jgi:RNA polymerase sigma-70 factor (ECF subfamily)
MKQPGMAMGAGEMPLEVEALAGPAREHELVARCREGDAVAFASLVEQNESMVFNLAARLLGDGEEAKDVAQDVFLQVYRQLGRFQGRRTWIYRIVVNQCHNRRRFWMRRGRHKEEELDERLAVPDAGGAPDEWHASPYERARAGERARKVQAALLRLSFEQRSVLVLREVEGLSCEEVAAALGIPDGTVKSRLSRAREALRQQLSGWLEEGDRP